MAHEMRVTNKNIQQPISVRLERGFRPMKLFLAGRGLRKVFVGHGRSGDALYEFKIETRGQTCPLKWRQANTVTMSSALIIFIEGKGQ